MAKKFGETTSQDFEIFDETDGEWEKFGTLRVRPSGLLWAPKGSHVWFRLSIEDFGDLAQRHGTKQKQ
jgi:hypothetical protein